MKVALRNGQRTGVMDEFYPNGVRRARAEWKNDRQHGVVEHYYESGQPQEVSHWRNDSLAGPYKYYYPTGNLSEIAYYERNVRVGDRLVFDDQGTLVEKQVYDDRGQLIYVAGFDKSGRQEPGIIFPVFTDKADTITLGQTFETHVSFGFELAGDVTMLVGKINNKTGEALGVVNSGY